MRGKRNRVPIFFVYLRRQKPLDMRLHLIIIALATLLVGCNQQRSTDSADVVVSIEPLKYIVERIVGDDLKIDVLTPIGTSPETYEPTPHDIISLQEAEMIFSTGLIEFETTLLAKIGNQDKLIELHHDIELIAGSCSHAHCDHHHGVDPHIWTSPRELRTMARNAHSAIMRHYPDSAHYTTAYRAFDEELMQLDKECCEALQTTQTKAFVIYHPALTYYARAYGLEQIAIESEGKEPSAKHIANIIEQAKAKGAKSLLYQKEFPRSVVEVIADDMGLEPTEINPLQENAVEFIREITKTITSN